jgi:NAD(P)-dependent dehydrogenase (short-subunit alcohol dehydrogenase family)
VLLADCSLLHARGRPRTPARDSPKRPHRPVGANKGLGREAARRLLADGHDVWAAARDPGRGLATAEELGARHLVLDVADDDSVEAAALAVADAAGGVLDVLINIAITPTFTNPASLHSPSTELNNSASASSWRARNLAIVA